MKGHRNQRGLTVIELLVVAAIVGIVLAVLAYYFATQSRVSNDVQARNRLETTLRSVAEVVMQDLQLAGSRAVYNGTSVTYLDLRSAPEPSDPSSPEWAAWKAQQCSSSHRDGCVDVATGSADLTIFYATSLDRGAGSACRRVDYRLVDETLFRRDVACDDSSTGYEGFEFADGIDRLTVTFICHDPDNAVDDIAECYATSTYPREATITVSGRVDVRGRVVQSAVTLATSLPNLRPPVDYVDL